MCRSSFRGGVPKIYHEKREAPSQRDGMRSGDVLGQGEYLDVLLAAELVGDGAEDPRADGLALLVDEDDGVVVELDLAAVAAPPLHRRAHHHAVDDVPLLDLAARLGLLHGGDDGVPQPRPLPPLHRLDAHHPLRPRVVHHLQVRPHLDEPPHLLQLPSNRKTNNNNNKMSSSMPPPPPQHSQLGHRKQQLNKRVGGCS